MEIMGYNIISFKGFDFEILRTIYNQEYRERGFEHFKLTEIQGFPVSKYRRLSEKDKDILITLVKYPRSLSKEDEKYILSKVKLPILEMPGSPISKKNKSLRLQKVVIDMINDYQIYEKFSKNFRALFHEWLELKGLKGEYNKRIEKGLRKCKKYKK